MDTLTQYRQIVEQTLLAHAKTADALDAIEHQTIFDRGSDHYLLVQVGWGRHQRIYGVVAHIDLVGEKIWIQTDGTEAGLAHELRQAGIPPGNIVLGYRLPEVRKNTEYAIA
jgi:XisI protein